MVNSRNHMPGEKRKDLTVRTVIDLCGHQDPATLTTASIAERMDLTQGALFRHFRNKEAIWEAVADWVSGRLLAHLDAAVDPSATPLEALERMFMAHIEFIARHPGVPRLMLGQLQHDRDTPARRVIDAMLTRYRERLMTVLADAERRNLVAELDRDAAATAFIGAIQGLVVRSMVAGDVKRIRALAPQVFALYRRGIAADGGQAK